MTRTLGVTDPRTRRASRAGALLLAWLCLGCVSVASASGAEGSQIASFSVTPSSQVAGAHGDLSVNLRFAEGHYPAYKNPSTGEEEIGSFPQEAIKKVTVALPPGLLANPTAIPACEDGRLGFEAVEANEPRACDDADQVGMLTVRFGKHEGIRHPESFREFPIFNLDRSSGQTARLGAFIISEVVHININLRDTSDYGVTATIEDLPDAFSIAETEVTLWGEPAASSHDEQRSSCFYSTGATKIEEGCSHSLAGSRTFMVNPLTCNGPTQATATAEFYDQPGLEYTATAPIQPFTGCEQLPFSPSLAFTPDSGPPGQPTGTAGQPSGFTADLTVPQEKPEEPTARATANVQNVSVTLPSGVALSPSIASGLAACSDEQFGFGSDAAPGCPSSSAIGTVRIHSPLADEELTGRVFVGSQESEEPASGNMYRLLLYAVGDGVTVKLVGHVAANPATGQLTATFSQDPQVAFDKLVIDFEGGPKAPLVNPTACGTATSTWSINSWSEPEKPVTGTSEFPVTGNCALADEFTPTLSAGPQSDGADAFSPFVFTLSRPDGQRELGGVPSVNLPPGLLARVGEVPECASAQASAGSCPESSQVGTATIAAGPGPSPFYLQGQPVYLTGPYNGAPFGLAVVAHAIAGPFNLGTVVVRQALFVEPNDAHVRIVSDPLPSILGGVPLKIQTISLDIDRPGFMFNPTNCSPMSVTATVTSTSDAGQIASANLSSPVGVDDCKALKFKPVLTAVTPASTSKKKGAGLSVHVAAAEGPQSSSQTPSEANIREVEVKLPKAFSARLATLNKACAAAVFDADPGSCPPESIVGMAVAHSPVLAEPLMGPAYIVSHGGEAFPDLELVLQADERGGEITIVLDGKTRVDTKHGNALTSDFNTVPDAPISSFDLSLPEGPHSILSSPSKSLCGRKLQAPTRIVAQDGALIEDATRIAVAGCTRPLHVRVSKSSKTRLRVQVQVPAAGTVRVSGPQIRAQSRRVGAATRLVFTLALDKKAAAAVAAGRKLEAKIALSFTPKTGRRRSAVATVKF